MGTAEAVFYLFIQRPPAKVLQIILYRRKPVQEISVCVTLIHRHLLQLFGDAAKPDPLGTYKITGVA